MRARVLCTVVAVASLALAASAAKAQQTMYLEVPGVPSLQGESTAENYENQIVLKDLSWGVAKTPASRPAFEAFTAQKTLDRASPALLQAVASGATFSSAKVHVVKPGDRPIENLTYCFTGVRFTSLHDSAEDEAVSEHLSWTYQTLIERYKQQADDGSVSGEFVGGWDLVRNLQFGGAASCS